MKPADPRISETDPGLCDPIGLVARIVKPYLAAMATSFPVSGMPAAVAASNSANMLAAWEPPASAIYAVDPRNRLMSMEVRAFVDHLARCFGKPLYRDAGL